MNQNKKQNEAPQNVVVIDGRNVAYDHGVESFNESRLLCCIRYFHSYSYEVEIHTIIPLWGINDENLEKLYELCLFDYGYFKKNEDFNYYTSIQRRVTH